MVNILNNLNVEKIFNKVEQKAPMLGTLYGVLGPLAETSKAVGDSPLDAILREIMALANPQMPTIEGIKGWWMAYSQPVAKNGILIYFLGELLGKPRLTKAGENIVKGTALAAVIGEVGRGGGAPYDRGGNPQNLGAMYDRAVVAPNQGYGY